MSGLLELADKYGTDKGSSVGSKTNFARLYELFFGHLKDEKIKLLEIGLNNGGPEHGSDRFDRVIKNCPSIKMWHEYFQNGQIWGWDVNDIEVGLVKSMKRFKFFKGDQGDKSAYENFETLTKNTYGGDNLFDIIIDDGSHAFYHQQMSFAYLSKMLKPGGFYVIEDTHWQPDENRGGSKHGGHAPFDRSKLPNAVNTKKFFDSIFIGKNHGTEENEDLMRAIATENMFSCCKRKYSKAELQDPHEAPWLDEFKSMDQYMNFCNHIKHDWVKHYQFRKEILNEIKLYDRILLTKYSIPEDIRVAARVLSIIILKKKEH